MAPHTQKALFIESKGGDFVVKETSVPLPGPGEVLIKVKAASLNPVDWKIQKFGMYVEHYPAIIGCDMAGDIEEIGEGVNELKKGDRVFCQADWASERASFQQFAIALAVTTARIPEGFSYDGMTSIPTGLSTAYAGFFNPNPTGLGLIQPTTYEARGRYNGQPILVIGGSSSVGQMAIQLAKISGFSPIITTSSLSHKEALEELGATYIIDRHLPGAELSLQVRNILGGQALSVAFDSISEADTQKIAVDLLAPGGQLQVTYIPTEKPNDKIVNAVAALLRLPVNIPQLEPLYNQYASAWVQEGIIKPNRVEVVPGGLSGIVAGLKKLESGTISRVKLIVRPHETT